MRRLLCITSLLTLLLAPKLLTAAVSEKPVTKPRVKAPIVLNFDKESNLEGSYVIESVQCKFKEELISNCSHGETLEVHVTNRAGVREIHLTELKEGRALREWHLSSRQSNSDLASVSALLTLNDKNMGFMESRTEFTGNDDKKQMRLQVSLMPEDQGFKLDVKKFEESQSATAPLVRNNTEITMKLRRDQMSLSEEE